MGVCRKAFQTFAAMEVEFPLDGLWCVVWYGGQLYLVYDKKKVFAVTALFGHCQKLFTKGTQYLRRYKL